MPKTKKQFVWMAVHKQTGEIHLYKLASPNKIGLEYHLAKYTDFKAKKFELKEVKNAKRNA